MCDKSKTMRDGTNANLGRHTKLIFMYSQISILVLKIHKLHEFQQDLKVNL